MDTYKLKITPLGTKATRLLYIKAGQKLSQRKIARTLNVSPTSIAKIIPLLEKRKIIRITRSKEMNLNLVELNRENQKVINLKKVENQKLIYESNLLELLKEKYPGCTIILFGSYAKGEDTINSDIDLTIIGSSKKNINLEKYEKFLEREIRINNYKTFKEINKELKENLCNGIVLSGGIEL
jgi:predicted nucleotidyltransferase